MGYITNNRKTMRNMRRVFRSSFIIVCCLVVLFAPIGTLALDRTFYAGNDVLMYNPEDGCIASGSGCGELDFRVASYNILHGDSWWKKGCNLLGMRHDKEACNTKRAELQVEIIEKQGLDIIGMQEVSPGQYRKLRELLPNYDAFPTDGSRIDNQKDGSTAIFWNKAKFKMVESGKTPGVSNVASTENRGNITAPWVALEGTNGAKLYYMSVHWPVSGYTDPSLGNVGTLKKGVNLAREWIKSKAGDSPMFIAGDFNDKPEERTTYCGLTEGGLMQNVFDMEKNRTGKCPSIGKGLNGIDHIYATPSQDMSASNWRKFTGPPSGQASDHKAVIADMKLTGKDCGNASGGAGGSSVFVIGDSLTVGMRNKGNLESKLTSAGWLVQGIEATGGITTAESIPKIRSNKDKIELSDTVVIGLGTNKDPGENFGEDIDNMIRAIKNIKQNMDIYWINIYAPGEKGEVRIPRNAVISAKSTEHGFKIIDWKTEAENNTQKYDFIPNNLHHTDAGYKTRADFIVESLSSTGSNTVTPAANTEEQSNCVCQDPNALLSGNDNEEKVWNFFISNGYTPQQTAGIIGNMRAESGVEPMRLQNTASGVETPSRTARNSASGWGLVQWTPAGKMINPSHDEGASYDEIDSLNHQVDFLNKQLNGDTVIPEKAAGDHLKTQTTVDGAAKSFMTKFERPADQSEGKQNGRAVLANSVFDKLNGSASGGSSSLGGSGDCGGGEGGFTDVSGIAMYYQNQEPWASKAYGIGTIEECGCGPTSLAIAVSTLTTNKTNPKQMADWFVDNGGQVGGSSCASNWIWQSNAELFKSTYGIEVSTLANTGDKLVEALKQEGTLVLMSQQDGGGYVSQFTSGGHIMLARGLTSGGNILVADPASESRTLKDSGFTVKEVMDGSKGLWTIKKAG